MMSKQLDYDLLAKEYAIHREVHPEVLARLIGMGCVTEVSNVLEVGCGAGNYLVALEKSTGCSCWGIDPSERMLAIAHERSYSDRLKIGRAEQLDFPEEFFDIIFSVDVIHHVGDRFAFFIEAYRVLKPGGKICTVTDSEDIIRNRKPLSVYFPETIVIELQRYPSIASLRNMLEGAGFHDLNESIAEYKYQLTDIGKYRDKAYSSLHLLEQETFNRGLLKIELDLQIGPIECSSRYILLWGSK